MRRLVAALACRLEGTRLYGKPLQNLDIDRRLSILEHQVDLLSSVDAISETVLGIAEGRANLAVVDFAERKRLKYIIGDERDVLSRLIACTREGSGTDTFRVTTESPFTYWEMIDEAWGQHVDHEHDVTVVDGVPLGSGFEIFTLAALEKSHEQGDERHRSELCSLYIREHREDFDIALVEADPAAKRSELRFTVDYPEDLILCRAVYERFKDTAPRIPMSDIIAFMDESPQLKSLVSGLASGPIW